MARSPVSLGHGPRTFPEEEEVGMSDLIKTLGIFAAFFAIMIALSFMHHCSRRMERGESLRDAFNHTRDHQVDSGAR